jgi:hypothetical protein
MSLDTELSDVLESILFFAKFKLVRWDALPHAVSDS